MHALKAPAVNFGVDHAYKQMRQHFQSWDWLPTIIFSLKFSAENSMTAKSLIGGTLELSKYV